MAYGTAKAALTHMTRLMAADLAPAASGDLARLNAANVPGKGRTVEADRFREIVAILPHLRKGATLSVAQLADSIGKSRSRLRRRGLRPSANVRGGRHRLSAHWAISV